MGSSTDLRRELHAHPDLSGNEHGTATRILKHFERLEPDETITDLGGSGLAFVFEGNAAGLTVMLRCELDALPIHESLELSYRSVIEGVSHKCGHDGHMSILTEVGARLARSRPARGRVVLLFQPAEETGQGAEAVIADPKFESVRPDISIALHNIPGFDLGRVVVKEGVFSSASRGMVIRLSGRTAHAAQPETGISPAAVMSRLITELESLASTLDTGSEMAFATVVGARLGEKAFGTAPGEAEIYATLRAERDETMDLMISHVEALVDGMSSEASLRWSITYEDVFAATINSPRGVEALEAAATRCGLEVDIPPGPFRWSEDFGRFAAVGDCLLFGLGAGVDHPDLHDADYDFPDELTPIGVKLLGEVVSGLLD